MVTPLQQACLKIVQEWHRGEYDKAMRAGIKQKMEDDKHD